MAKAIGMLDTGADARQASLREIAFIQFSHQNTVRRRIARPIPITD
ncbi:hypothetical protein [Acuticoccus kandeliae]|nr:hypothetical protein [Acuticoccus kandeliae]